MALIQQPTLNLDLPSTILDYACVQIPKMYQGQSMVSLLLGDAPQAWRTETFYEHHQHRDIIPKWSGIRGDRYVYACYDLQNPPYEFFHDLKRDPHQLVNFAKDPEYASLLKEFREKNEAAIRTYGRESSTKESPDAK